MARMREPLGEVARRWVEESCAEQAVPVKVAAPTVIDDVAELLEAGREGASAARQA